MQNYKIIFLWWTPWAWKSTWIKENQNITKNFKVLEFDDFVRKYHLKNHLNKKLKWFILYKESLKYFKEEFYRLAKNWEKIILDFTNLRKEFRKEFLNFLKKEKIKFSWIWIESNFHEWIDRNKNREFILPIENQILFHCYKERFEKSEWFEKIISINYKKNTFKEKKYSNEIKNFLEDINKYKKILNFPEISEIKKEIEFFDISLSNILKNPKKSSKENLWDLYEIICNFYFQKLQFNKFYLEVKDNFWEKEFKENFLKKITRK